MKLIVKDITNHYDIVVVDNYEQALTEARLYVNDMFNYMRNHSEFIEFYEDDMLVHNLIGISIGDIDYFHNDGSVRTNYFFGHIKEDGTVVNKNEG